MKSTRIILAGITIIAGTVLSHNVSAHALWLEDNAGIKLYFGEYNENLREPSPGRLDTIIDPLVTVIDNAGNAKTVNPTRGSGYFSIPEGGTAVLVQAIKQSIREPQGEIPAPTVKRHLYARIGKGGSLPLDLESSDNLLRLSFLGKPVPRVEIIVIAPNGWEKHVNTNERGEVPLSSLDPGLYVVEAKYEFMKPGEFEGKAYTVESHKVTFSFYK